MNAEQKIKLVLVTNMLPPYRVSFYEELAKLVDLTVVLDTISEFNRGWKVDVESLNFELVVLDSHSFVYTRKRKDVSYEEKRQFHFSEKVFPALKELKPDLVVSIEFGLKTFWSELFGYFFKVPVVMLSEGTLHTEGHVGVAKRVFRRLLVSQASGAWSNGPDSTALLESYGLSKERCQEGMTGIETEAWRAQVESYLEQREALREQWGLKGRVFLFSASLTPRKGVREMLAAAQRLVEEGREFSLLILGGGEEEGLVQDFAGRHPQIPLHAPGFIQRDELPKYFAAADWAVLPTLDDNWPLATLETLVAGLPQIFSKYNGASCDLCEPGITGWVCDPLNTEDFVEVWRRALAAPDGRIPAEVIDRHSNYYGPEAQAQRAFASAKYLLSQESHG